MLFSFVHLPKPGFVEWKMYVCLSLVWMACLILPFKLVGQINNELISEKSNHKSRKKIWRSFYFWLTLLFTFFFLFFFFFFKIFFKIVVLHCIWNYKSTFHRTFIATAIITLPHVSLNSTEILPFRGKRPLFEFSTSFEHKCEINYGVQRAVFYHLKSTPNPSLWHCWPLPALTQIRVVLKISESIFLVVHIFLVDSTLFKNLWILR